MTILIGLVLVYISVFLIVKIDNSQLNLIPTELLVKLK